MSAERAETTEHAPLAGHSKPAGRLKPGRLRPAWRRGAGVAFAINAAVAWTGVILTVPISGLGGYEPTPMEGNLYGDHPDGAAGAISRLSDTLSYFTIWSNIVVAVSLTMLALQPHVQNAMRRVLRLTGVLMITITAIVNAVLLAPSAVIVGWSRLTDPILHYLTPAVTLLVWLVVGPRGWISWRTVLASMILPLAWIAWMVGRGEIVGAYPYGFADVGTRGFPAVAMTLAAIVASGLVVSATFWLIDRLLVRVGHR